ncbi:MAG: UTP--glucose-1-phosphate uridylyltransferase, partial [Planctomycetota bacterium]
KVLAASRRYERAVPWVLLVSDNEGATRAYFEENAWFGLEGRVRFVRQRMLPAVDDDGKIILRSPHRIALSPNGHGGSIEAIASGGALSWLEDGGVEIVSYFQVDNALVNAADPAFLGYQSLRGAEMSAKVVMKNDPLEKAGVVALLDGKPGVIEYSELPEELARKTDKDGRLLYGLANIAAHGLSVAFLSRMSDRGLPFHQARKNVPTVDADGNPTETMGRKFETFIFDAIPLARGANVFLGERREEFSPLKNAKGDCSPGTVREALLSRTRHWYERAGRTAPESDEELEMSPLCAYDFETFGDWIALSGGRDEP